MSNTGNVTPLPTRHEDPQLRGLPAWVYGHPQLTRLEIERILRPSWQIACRVSQIPAAGEYVTFELGRSSRPRAASIPATVPTTDFATDCDRCAVPAVIPMA